jgi:hypothetical protein
LYDRTKPWREWTPQLAEAMERFSRPAIEHPDLDAGRALLRQERLVFRAQIGSGPKP